MSTGSRLRRLRTHAEAAPAAPTARGGTSLAGLESRLYESFTSVLPAWAFRAAADPFAYGLTGGAPFGTATGTVSDRQHGRNVPLVWSELDLRGYRILSRQLCDSNQFAIGFLKLLSAFHIRKGYGWQACLKGAKKTPYPTAAGPVDPLVEKAQQILDAWRDANQWPLLSREAFRRWCRDGEVFGRWFPQGYGELSRFRFIEPEQVGSPTGDTSDIDSYGIETERGDVCTPTAYHVWKLDESLEGDWVDADRIVHARKNVDSGIKRGLPDFYPVAEDLDGVRRLLRGLTASAIKQARTAWIEKFKSATVEQVRAQLPVYAAGGSNNLQLQGTDDVTRAIIEQFGRFGLNGQALADVRKVEGDREFVPGPTTNAGPLIEVEQAVLRGAGVVWNFPEYFSGDASNNNFASSLVSGSPFTVTVESSQFEWGCVWERPAAIKALEFARDAGLLSYQEWSRLDVEVTEPAVVTPQPDKDTQTYVQQLQARIVSLDTVRQKLGYDPQHEAEGVKKDAATAPPPPGGAPGAPGQEPPPDQGPPGGDGGGGPPGTDDPMAGLFGEQAVAEGLTDAQYALLTVEARAGLVLRTVGTRDGKQVRRWVRTDTGAGADAHGAAKGTPGEHPVHRALRDPAAPTPDQLKQIGDVLKGLSKEQLRHLALAARQRIGGAKQQIADRLLDHLKARAAPVAQKPTGTAGGKPSVHFDAAGKPTADFSTDHPHANAKKLGDPAVTGAPNPGLPDATRPPVPDLKRARYLHNYTWGYDGDMNKALRATGAPPPGDFGGDPTRASLLSGLSPGAADAIQSVATALTLNKAIDVLDALPDPVWAELQNEFGDNVTAAEIKDFWAEAIKNENDGGGKPHKNGPEMFGELRRAFAAAPAFGPPPIAVNRGISVTDKVRDQIAAAAEAARAKGEPITLNGFQSTALGEGFPGNVEYTIDAIHGLDMRPYSHFPNENELLLNHGCRYEVVDVKKGVITRIHLRQITTGV